MKINLLAYGDQYKMKLFSNPFRKKKVDVTPPAQQSHVELKEIQKKTNEKSNDILKDTVTTSSKKIPDPKVPSSKEKSEGILDRIHRCVRNFFYKQCKGKGPDEPKKINEAMRNIGGEPIDRRTSEGAELRGMHFRVSSIVEKMQTAGAQRVTITKNSSNEAISAIVLPRNVNTNDLMNSFEVMGLFEKKYFNKNKGTNVILAEGVWEKRDIDGKTYIFTKENFQKLTDNCSPFMRGKFNTDEVSVSAPFNRPFIPSQNKTIVLNGGLYSHFESGRTSSEVAKFIALGFNVIVSEDKHPRVHDSESHSKVMASRDEIYKYLKENDVKNEDIIWKGTCFSSVPAAEAAAKYPGTGLWVDQGYIEPSEFFAHKVPYAPGFLKPIVKPVVAKVAKSVDFDYNMEKFLPEIQGPVILLRNDRDQYLSGEHHAKMQDILSQNDKEYTEFHITDENIRHAGAWFKDSECNKQIVDHLINSGMSDGDILA